MTPEQESSVLEVLDGAQHMTIATIREDGYPQATTVSFVHDGRTVYFCCDPDCQKARNIGHSDKVSLTVNLPYGSWSEIRGLSLAGRAKIVADQPEMGRVFDAMAAKFPQIVDYTTEDERQNVSVVRVEPEIISLIDYREEFGHAEEFRV